MGLRSYVSEPERGRRKWRGKQAEQEATYANRRRVRGERGKGLLRRRGEKLERPFAHQFETGAMRRLQVRGLEEVRKKLLIQAAACNLALLLRTKHGAGTPRGLAEAAKTLCATILGLSGTLRAPARPHGAWISRLDRSDPPRSTRSCRPSSCRRFSENGGLDTGC